MAGFLSPNGLAQTARISYVCICYKCLQFILQITKDGKPRIHNPRARKIPREEGPTGSANNVANRDTGYVRQCFLD